MTCRPPSGRAPGLSRSFSPSRAGSSESGGTVVGKEEGGSGGGGTLERGGRVGREELRGRVGRVEREEETASSRFKVHKPHWKKISGPFSHLMVI